jgi:hypothetical protein
VTEPIGWNDGRGELDLSRLSAWLRQSVTAALRERAEDAGLSLPAGWITETAARVTDHARSMAHPILSGIIFSEARAAAHRALARDQANLIAERDRLAEQVRRVRELHRYPTPPWPLPSLTCKTCSDPDEGRYVDYPCATLCALDGGAP